MNAYYLQTEQMTVGYHGKPLIEKINLCLRRGAIMTGLANPPFSRASSGSCGL